MFNTSNSVALWTVLANASITIQFHSRGMNRKLDILLRSEQIQQLLVLIPIGHVATLPAVACVGVSINCFGAHGGCEEWIYNWLHSLCTFVLKDFLSFVGHGVVMEKLVYDFDLLVFACLRRLALAYTHVAVPWILLVRFIRSES